MHGDKPVSGPILFISLKSIYYYLKQQIALSTTILVWNVNLYCVDKQDV